MKINDFYFSLPEGLIAQEPRPDRDRSRLMIVDRSNGRIEHRSFFEIADYLKSGDVLVINNTKVIPARLVGIKETGGRVEAFLLERLNGKEDIWECLVGGKRVRSGLIIEFHDALRGEVLEELGDGRFRLLFHCDKPFEEALEEIGLVPLPPYIKRVRSHSIPSPSFDKERYQTVFAEKKGAVAAPTAGLHFSETLLETIRNKGVEVAPITLHVGPGTFLPVRVERIEEHRMLPEQYEISPDAADRINKAKAGGGRIVAVGTTSVRATEAAADDSGVVVAGSDRTSIFIYPGYAFKAVNALVTNFHLPKSTLLMLVSAFAGRGLMLEAYREAIDKGYRFYSYGDAMMIV